MDNNKTIFRSAIHFFSGTMISRFTGLLRDILMAFAFGTHSSIASLMVAFRLSHLLRRLFGEGAMHAAFVPHYESYKQTDPQKAISFFWDVKRALTIILAFIVSISSFMLAYFVYSNGSEIAFLTLLLMPGLFFICQYSLNSSLLQCEREFLIPSISPVTFNCIWILGTLTLFNIKADKAAPWLAFFIVLASIAQSFFTMHHAKKILNNFSHVKKKEFITKEIKNIIGPMILSIIGVASTQINSALDPLFAKFANSEGPAYLWYSIRIYQLPLSLIGIALGSALLPSLSRAYENNEMEKFKNFLDNSMKKIILFMMPISLALIFSADTCVNLLYGRGGFGIHSINQTTLCLVGYSLGLIPSALILILAPGFYAKKDFKTPMIFSVISVIINIFLNSVFVFAFSWGAFSVALSTTISSWINFLGLYLLIGKESRCLNSASFTYMLLKIFSTCLLALISLFFINHLFYEGNYLIEFFSRGKTLLMPKSFLEQLFKFISEAIAFGIPIIILWGYELKTNLKKIKAKD